MIKKKILITSPSLDTNKNVSGISTLTNLLVKKNSDVNYYHFKVGREDNQKRNLVWIFYQFRLIISFIYKLIKIKFDLIHINMPLSELAIIINFILIIISKILFRNVIVHLRGGKLSLNENINLLQFYIIYFSLKFSNKVIVLGLKEKKYISKKFSINTKKIHVLPNAVEVPKFKKRTNFSDIKIIFLGRIDQNKGIDYIFTALNELKSKVPFKFYMAGTGPYQKICVPKFSKHLGKRFNFLGIQNHDEKKDIFSKSHIFILPSYFEGLPNALLEAMAFGLVPLVTSVGSIGEVVEDKKNGIIVPKFNHKEISENIINLFRNNNFYNNLSLSAFKTIKKRFSLSSYIVKLNKIYCGVI
jgi:glycosyltransferase involved in cell wall biosynthesis